MRDGPLRHRVTIESVTETRAADGAIVRTWASSSIRWAQIEPIKSREFFSSQAVESDVTHRIIMRHFSGLTSKHRITHDSRVFNIVGPPRNIHERDRMLELMVRENV